MSTITKENQKNTNVCKLNKPTSKFRRFVKYIFGTVTAFYAVEKYFYGKEFKNEVLFYFTHCIDAYALNSNLDTFMRLLVDLMCVILSNKMNLIFAGILLYPYTNYSHNNLLEHYYTHSAYIKRIPVYFYYTHMCLYSTLITIVLDILNLTNFDIVLNAFTMNFICILTFWPLYFSNPVLVKPPCTLIDQYHTPISTELALHLAPFIISFVHFIHKIKGVRRKVLFKSVFFTECTIQMKPVNYLLFFISISIVTAILNTAKYIYKTYPYKLLERFGFKGTLIFALCIYMTGITIKVLTIRIVNVFMF